jgi:hypothetical protein
MYGADRHRLLQRTNPLPAVVGIRRLISAETDLQGTFLARLGALRLSEVDTRHLGQHRARSRNMMAEGAQVKEAGVAAVDVRRAR